MIRGPDFLVVGMNKSGSYWLAAMLDAHPEINCFPTLPGGKSGVGEPHFFDVLGSIDEDNGVKFVKSFTKTRNGYFADLVPYFNKISRNELYNMFRDRYSQWCDSFRKKRLVGEKTQEYIFYLDLIDYCYPVMKKICIVRDIKDRVVSFHFNEARKGRQDLTDNISDDFVDAFIKRANKEYSILNDYKGNMYCYTYESMKTEPQKMLVGILEYLEVEVSEDISKNMVEAGSFERLSALDKLSEKKINSDATGVETSNFSRKPGEELWNSQYRKGIVGDWRNHLTQVQADRMDLSVKEIKDRVFKKYNLTV
ncbi:MAG: sulfotransferase domain-containing protein [Minisyncoccia bacterium]